GLAITAVIAAIRATNHRAWGGLAIALVVLGAWGQHTYSANRVLSDFNVAENIADRIIPSESKTAWFVDHGMPLPPGITPGQSVPADPLRAPADVLRIDPAFAHWVHADGMKVYVHFLLAHPWYTFRAPLDDFVGTSPLTGNNDPGIAMLAPTANYGETRDLLPAPIEDALLSPGNAGSLIIGGIVVAVYLVMQWRRRGYDSRWTVPIAVLVIDAALLWIIWHGAPGEAARHSVAIAVTARVAVMMLAAFLLDRWLVDRRQDTGACASERHPAPSVP
ncbi:MAG TPA: hypothetical protein VGJ03_06035, partial [Acidimicrobiales bacterium]